MALQISYAKVFDVPVAPDGISQGSTSLATVPTITGDFVQNININLRTYTFDLKGINEQKAQEIIDICNTNAEALAKGEVNLQNPTGAGMFTYRSAKCLPIAYQDGGTIRIGTNTNNFASFQVTCLTDTVVASI
jgi:hypothetical protein